MGKKRRRRRSGGSAAVVTEPVPAPGAGALGEGVVLFVRRALSWALDFVVSAGLVSVFYFCAGVFYLDEATVPQGNLMLVCAVVTLLLLTVYIPYRSGGQTLGERIFSLRVVNRDGSPRSAVQIFVRECVLKVGFGPFVAAFCVLDYVALGLIYHRDPEPDLILDYFLKTRVVPVGR